MEIEENKMRLEMFEKILTPILNDFINVDFDFIERVLLTRNLAIKERIDTVRNMKIIIYSNDHEPPHFHVVSNDNSIDAKFSIDSGEFISGMIDSKDIKRIKAFYQSPKTEMILKKIWNEKQ